MIPPKQGFLPPPTPPASSEEGFSIIEGLIASLLLLVVTLGILPLFSRAMNNNIKGNDSTRQSNGAVDALETSLALPFNSGDMTMPVGSTSVVVADTLALKKIASPTGGADQTISTRWELPADLGTYDVQVMNRQQTLQQYAFSDFADDQIFEHPLDGTTEPRRVHFKVVDIALQDATSVQAVAYRLRIVQAY